MNPTIDEVRASYKSEIRKLRARFNGLLQSELLPLLLDAHDASTMTPPRVHVILDRLDQAVQSIRKEASELDR